MTRVSCSVFFALLVGVFLPNDTFAASKPKVTASVACWQRVYSKTDLRRHRGQKVTMALLTVETQEDGSVTANLGLTLRKRTSSWKYDYSISGLCKPDGDTLVCTPEWDAGSFVLEKGARNGLRVKNRKLVVNPYDHDSEDISPKAVNFRKSDDAIWLLFSVDPSVCNTP